MFQRKIPDSLAEYQHQMYEMAKEHRGTPLAYMAEALGDFAFVVGKEIERVLGEREEWRGE